MNSNKDIYELLPTYSDKYIEIVLHKRNGYREEIALAFVEEAITRGLISSPEEVNFKYPLIEGSDDFGENLLNQLYLDKEFEKVQQHYLWIGYVCVALSIIGVFKGYFFAPFLPALYLLGVYRCTNQFNRQLYTVLHIVSYVLVFGMVLFVGSLF